MKRLINVHIIFNRLNLTGLCFIIIMMCISIIVRSRAFFIGSFCGLLFTAYYNSPFRKRSLMLWTIAILVIGLLLTFCFKYDSTLGRELIYKVSNHIFKDHWITGIGFGNYSRVYLRYQANYFASGKYSSKELLLADNTYYAFNDYYQFIIETGIFGAIILMAAALTLIYLLRSAVDPIQHVSQTILISISIIITISVAALFTYAFHIFTFQLLYYSSICVLLYFGLFRSKKAALPYIVVLFLSGAFTLTFISFRLPLQHYQDYQDLKYTKELSLAGFKKEALSHLKNLYPGLKDDPQYLWYYGSQLQGAGQFHEALQITTMACEKMVCNDLLKDLGNCYAALNQNAKAEESYLESINMVPNRFATRYKLFQFYLVTGQTAKANELRKVIAALPIKVQSSQVDFIKAVMLKPQ